MREKLDHMQAILEAVVTSDWKRLEAHSRDLERLTEDPRWTILNFQEYVRQSAQFKRKVADLHGAAAARDLEETPKAYVAVTLSCVECHRYLARARIADVAPSRAALEILAETTNNLPSYWMVPDSGHR
jgi:hypothetical protein